MSLEHLPADLQIHDRVGRAMVRHAIERGDTVSFNYYGERRHVLVLENDGIHLKGIDKIRHGDYRNFLFRKITNIQYATPFVKQNVAVSYEMLPEMKPCIARASGPRDIEFQNRQGVSLLLRVYHDGSTNVYKNGNLVNPVATFKSTQPLDMFVCISNFLSE